MTSVSGVSAERYEEMAEKLSVLCFGDSLTAGYYSYGLEYHPYAGKLKESLEAAFSNTEITVDVDGMPGDLAISPPGVFLSRIREKCAKRLYDWVVFLGGTKYTSLFSFHWITALVC